MKLLALVQDPPEVCRFLTHLGLFGEPEPRAPARAPPYFKSPALRHKHSAQFDFST